MMALLRYLLLIVTAICFVTLSYEVWNALGEGIFPWGAYGLWVSLILNFIYLSHLECAQGIERIKQRPHRIDGAKV